MSQFLTSRRRKGYRVSDSGEVIIVYFRGNVPGGVIALDPEEEDLEGGEENGGDEATDRPATGI